MRNICAAMPAPETWAPSAVCRADLPGAHGAVASRAGSVPLVLPAVLPMVVRTRLAYFFCSALMVFARALISPRSSVIMFHPYQ